MRMNNRGNWTLISLLAAVVIVMIVCAMYFTKGGGVGTVQQGNGLLDKGSTKKTVVGQAMDTGKSVDCRQRLNQIRAGIQMYKQTGTGEENPPSLKEAVSGVSTDYFNCPVSGKAYEYDRAAGTVKCPTHPGF